MVHTLNLHGVVYKEARSGEMHPTIQEALSEAARQSINYESRVELVRWLQQMKFKGLAERVQAISDAKFKVLLEDFKRISLLSGKNVETTLTTLDKPPTYEYTNTNESTIFDSGPGAPMQDTTDQKFLDRARSLLKPQD